MKGLGLVEHYATRYNFSMSRSTLLIIAGILVLFSPFAGLPLSWLAWILPILGAIVILIGITLRRIAVKHFHSPVSSSANS